MRLNKYIFVVLSLWVATNPLPVCGQTIEAEITVAELQQHISYLASDELKGRRSGSAEAILAAEYIKKEFAASGLQLLGEQGFQTFEVLIALVPGPNNALSVDGEKMTPGLDFNPLGFSENSTLKADVVFAGYGFDFSTDSLAWHDYEGLDVNGKWVLILRDGPESGAGNDPYGPYRSLRKKVQTAKDLGAGGILFVSGAKTDVEDALLQVNADQGAVAVGLPVLHITRRVADKILTSQSHTVTGLEEALVQTSKPASLTLPVQVEAQSEILRQMGETHNVVAMLPGSDPVLQDQYVIIGAHYDHLGMGGPGSGSRRPDTLAVHNGADDNASGVAAVLELAEKMAAHRQEINRSIVFIAFAAEEMGTIGSKYFTENPLVDIRKIQIMINLDMVGRFNEETRAFNIGGTGTAPDLAETVQSLANQHNLKPTLSPEGYGPSDHAAFYGKDLSVLFFMTSIGETYHTPDDDIETLNLPGEKTVADFVYETAVTLANRPEKLTFQEAGPKSQPAPSRRFKVTLGIMPDFTASGIKGLRADMVMPDRPASRAGMKKGDIIVAMEGKPVNDIYEYMNRLADFQPGQRISIEILRNGVKEIVIVEL